MAKKSFLHHTAVLHYQRNIAQESDAAPRIKSFPVTRSLLYRASQVKGDGVSPGIIDFSLPEQLIQTDGLDSKDAQEIQAHIEALSRKNRITLSSKELKITPSKNGVLFLLVVNSLMWGIAAGVLMLISQVVTGDRVQSTYDQGFSSVEGQLIQQMRQDSELRLSEKEQEIAVIRKQLASLKTEELTAVNKFEELLKQREKELQTRLEQDLADERKRLITTGISAETTEALLTAYGQTRFAYYRAELDTYQAQLEAERDAARANYQQLQDKYQEDLRNLNEERRLIKETLVQNENQLRLDIEDSTATKAETSLERNRALEEARTKLVVLQEQQQQALLRDNHIIGMYATIRTSLEQEHYQNALVQAESLIRYLEETPQESLPSLRWSLDRYLAGVLARIARTELTRAGEPSPQIIDLEAQIALLSADNARLTQVSQELSRALADQGLTGEAKITDRDARIARLTQANQELSQALAEQDRTRMTERGDLEARIARLSADNARLTQANQELSQALAEQDRTRRTEQGDLETRIARLSADNTRLTQVNQELSQALAEQDHTKMTERGDLEARIARLSADNARLTQANQELSQALADQNQRIGGEYQSQLTALEEHNRRLQQRIEEQVVALTQVTEEGNKTADTANTYIALTNAYTRYTATPGGLSDMEYFFKTPEVDQTFPGFFDRLMDLNRHISQDAYQEGIVNAASIIETALRIPQQDTRIKYLEGIRERYGSDPHISNLITMLLSRL
ncbi:MAG: hypothetical protein LBF75_06320 [Treponema sp.]|jgi:hypothetical protein|nr:hypothetical protein [Treponema sp.]